ncbi:MAG: hypothetical protein AAFN50_14335, partial [Pseudomonadota bacterium]
AHRRHALVGDPVYGGRLALPKGASPELVDTLRGFKRQALHAAKLGVSHPVTGVEHEFEAPLPEDFAHLVGVLERDADGR